MLIQFVLLRILLEKKYKNSKSDILTNDRRLEFNNEIDSQIIPIAKKIKSSRKISFFFAVNLCAYFQYTVIKLVYTYIYIYI